MSASTVNAPKPKMPTEAENERAITVQAKLAELAAAHGLDLDHPENWRDKEVRLRDRLLDEAEGSVLGSRPTRPAVGPAEFTLGDDPVEAVNEAKRAHAAAITAFEAAEEVFSRADRQLANAESELNSYADLDQQTADHHVRMLKEGRATDLPATLRHRLAERGNAQARHHAATAAHARLEKECATAREIEHRAGRIVAAAASAYLMHDACNICDDLKEVEVTAIELRAMLLSLAAAYLPGVGGPSPLPHKISAAINTPAKEAEPRQSLMDIWREKHAEIIAADVEPKDKGNVH